MSVKGDAVVVFILTIVISIILAVMAVILNDFMASILEIAFQIMMLPLTGEYNGE